MPGYHANSSSVHSRGTPSLCRACVRVRTVEPWSAHVRLLFVNSVSTHVHSCCLAAKRSKAPQRKAKAQTNVPDSTKPAPATKPKRAPSKKRTEADEVAGDAADEEIENADLSASVLHSVRWARLVLDEAHKIKASLLRARVPSLSTGRSFAHPPQYVCGVHGCPRRALTRSSGLTLACTAARCEGTVSHCGAARCSVSRLVAVSHVVDGQGSLCAPLRPEVVHQRHAVAGR